MGIAQIFEKTKIERRISHISKETHTPTDADIFSFPDLTLKRTSVGKYRCYLIEK